MVHVILAAAIAIVTASLPGMAQVPDTGAPDRVTAADTLVTTHPALRRSLDRLWLGSPSWRQAIDALAPRGQRIVLLTPDQVVVQSAVDRRRRPFEHDLIAEVSPVADAGGRVQQVLVVINVPLLLRAHAERRTVPADIDRDLDRIVAHEVYGHAIPYLVVGDLSGHCADPQPGQRPAEACAIRRENVVRAELGLGQRADEGLQSLAMARRFRH